MELAKCKICGSEATAEMLDGRVVGVFCSDEDCQLDRWNMADKLTLEHWQKLNDDTPRITELCNENAKLRVLCGEAAEVCESPGGWYDADAGRLSDSDLPDMAKRLYKAAEEGAEGGGDV